VGNDLFINARTDLYLQNLVPENLILNSTIERLSQYAKAGANCAFVPGLTNISDTQAILNTLDISINLMIDGNQKEIEQFSKLGVNRLSLGPRPFIDAYSTLVTLGSSSNKVEALDYSSLNNLF
jgi:2-methylisocitrate lyase-like PEP mutase family enzyme